MKNLIIVFIILLSGTTTAISAQKMLPKQKGIEIGAGLVNDKISKNHYFNAAFIRHSKKGNYMIYSLEYSKNSISYKMIDIPVKGYTVEIGYSFNLIADRRKSFMINLTFSALGGFEDVNKGKQLLFDGSKLLNESSMIYGGSGKMSIEIYLSDRIVLIASGKTKLLWSTTLEKIRPSAGLGIRFNL
ncbi:conjugal transfer protein TraO [Chryseobacterium sp. Ch-15]|uniref:Conjugal transfer protein TraO n=1 Tax=Chryseobacterium muglaense TaxID=2893752 RepID=A0A9Q3YQG6_9FLAO|nr:conjugal transfer protein TraO [Chryseobacterium muglaense]MBD3906084.1 conjugal transfer protein TraO [Chryseobacterium muglaense]MCC9032978.1 conjugal transfer protein TraO [Chryseobacterium muglaense]MCM2556558.1 conjugal transfer protein TraO [Chryseobacterium muglaense]